MRFIIVLLFLCSSFTEAAQPLPKVGLFSSTQKKFQIFAERLRKSSSTVQYDVHSLEHAPTFEEYETLLKKNSDYALVILVDNAFLELHREYNRKHLPIKALSVLSLNLEIGSTERTQLAGIRYEAPAFTLLTQFRYLFKKDLRRVLAIYRQSATGSQVSKALQDLPEASLQLEAVDLDLSVSKGQSLDESLAEALTAAGQGTHDALWIPLDSEVLSPERFRSQWLPFARKIHKPILVQEETLAKPQLDFGTFAVSTNVDDLADQSNQLLEDLLAGKFNMADIGVEESVSVDSFINTMKQRELNLKTREGSVIEL